MSNNPGQESPDNQALRELRDSVIVQNKLTGRSNLVMIVLTIVLVVLTLILVVPTIINLLANGNKWFVW